MPEGEAPRPAEAETKPDIQEARRRDTAHVTDRLFRKRVPQNPTSEQAAAIDGDPVAKKIFSSEYFGNVTKKQIGEGIQFPDGSGDDKPLMVTVDGEQVQLVSIVKDQADDVDDLGAVRCEVQLGKGDTAMREVRPISRQAIIEANLVAERDAILEGYSDREREVVEAYLDSIDHSVPEDKKKVASDEAIKDTAASSGMMTMEDTQQTVDLVATDDTAIQDKLKALDGRLVLGDDEFLDLGMTNAAINDKMSKIAETRDRLAPTILKDGDPDYDAKFNTEEQINARRDHNEANEQYALLARARRTEARARAAKAGTPLPVPDADATTDFDVDAPERKGDAAAQVINEQITRIADAMRDTPEDKRNTKEYLEQRHMLANLRMAQEATGPYGAIIQQQVLEQIRDKSSTPQIGVERVLNSQEFKDQVTQAQKDLGEFYDAKGFSAEDKKMMGEAMADPQKFESLMENDKFAKASQEMLRGFFGGDLQDTQIDRIMQNLTDANNDLLDTRFRNKLKEFFTENKAKKLGILAIILASLPVAVAALTATAAVSTAGLASGGARH